MTLEVCANFTTGNGLVVSADERKIALDRDLRDSTGDRWYWHVRLRSPTDQTITVEMARPLLLGQFGPALSTGGDYAWQNAEQGSDSKFEVSLVGGSTIAMCATIPYGPDELQTFRTRLGRRVRWRTLVQTEGGRPVPMLTATTKQAKTVILLTARHHACEALASYVMEGAIHEFVRLRDLGDPVVRSAELIAVPMVDLDGVCAGDQGKARSPWDHGRDYGPKSRYQPVLALRRLLLQDDRPIFALDLHTPGLRGDVEERSYVVTSGDTGDFERARDFLTVLLSDAPVGELETQILVFDQDWNSSRSKSQRCLSAWLRSRPNTRIALPIEYPNAVDRGLPVLPKDARRFGATLLCSLAEVMR